jgi:hypothetical protein
LGILFQYLSEDHERLDRLLARAAANPDSIDLESYSQFRTGLLRHIAIEEKVVLPAIARLQNGRQAEVALRLRLDHGALVALLVPSPTKPIVATIRSILRVHNPLEEREGGLYRILDKLAGSETDDLLEKLKKYPEVPALPYNDRPGTLDATRRAVQRAGYEPEF